MNNDLAIVPASIQIGGKELTQYPFITKASGKTAEVWENYPVVLRGQDISCALAVLQNDKLPSEKAGIDKRDLSQAMKEIDNKFQKKMRKYKKEFIEKSNLDLDVISKLEKTSVLTIARDRISLISNGHFYDFISILCYAVIVILHRANYIREQGHAHRIEWLKDVNKSEKKRQEKMKTMLEEHANVLIEDSRENSLLVNDVKLKQLSDIYKAQFPGKKLIVGAEKIDIDRYLEDHQLSNLDFDKDREKIAHD